MRKPMRETRLAGWGGRIRTSEWRNQNPSPGARPRSSRTSPMTLKSKEKPCFPPPQKGGFLISVDSNPVYWNSNDLEPARIGSLQHRRNMKRRRDDIKILDVLTRRHPGLGFSSSGYTVLRIHSSDNEPTTIAPPIEREDRKQLEDRWIVWRYNEIACCPHGERCPDRRCLKYCKYAIADIVDKTGRGLDTIRNTLRQYGGDGTTTTTARSS
jgi:hypothetical protein